MAKPVVVTPQALDGIECEAGKEVVLAEDAGDFAEQVCGLLHSDAPKLAAAARRRVVSDYSWEGNLRQFRDFLEGEPLPGAMDNRHAVEATMSADPGAK